MLSTTLLLSCGGGGSSSPATGGSDDGSLSCTVAGQNRYFLDYMRENYFWYEDIPTTVDPAEYASVYDLLDAIRSDNDRFSYILTEQEYQDRFVNAEYIGFGFSTRFNGDRVFINYVFDESPAAQAGLRRADEILAIDGVPVGDLIASGGYNEALGPREVGVTVTLDWQRPDGTLFNDILTKEQVETNTVLATKRQQLGGREVGYYVLNSFIDRTGADLNEAYNALVGVDDLVIDLRYNGGGLIRYANQAATQAAGNNVIGNTFVSLRFNDKNSDNNATSLFELIEGVQQLDLNRVFVLTTASSCSSSELIINGLQPFIDVVVIGQRTCGKPVGQSPDPFCDKRSFVINFETVNANGDGRYFDGIPVHCSADDRLVGDWGTSGDPLLAEAKHYIVNGSCSSSGTASMATAAQLTADEHPLLQQWRNEF
ncbi:PDZ domain-containing protein [Pseudidiomarina sp. 1APP75-32.1]|uniref:PDZ domain-containing protein n=1 Tax=Pseudidiomarina terrestris TaxID=2820060 RepID=A0AAW7QZR8_9GAMM|nr:S41 family peptidase [Pseudidiomarina sp. 1APP75-32.1]MDN7125696.1 PDZ domain-containing protein [Pseudidiomarina sp. 1APP75-32.1]